MSIDNGEAGHRRDGGSVPVLDHETWYGLADLLGAERVLKFAADLRDSLGADVWRGDCPGGTQLLQKAAHACVSLAGQIGFLQLSDAARDLEAACLDGVDIAPTLARFDSRRRQALARLMTLAAADATRPADAVA
jgi:hypothetical protein